MPVTVSELCDTQSLGSISSLDTASLGSPGRPSPDFSPGCSPSPSTNPSPDHPNDQDEASLEEQRLLLVEASKKARLDESLIKEKMDLTFSLRRKEVVDKQPMVQDLKDRWPALFFKDQIGEEFFRITNKNLVGTFRAAVEKYAPLLLRLYRARKTEFGKDLNEILRRLDDETTNIVRHRKEAAMKGLPVFLREDPNQLFKQCLETDSDDVAAKGVTVGILYVLEDCVAEASSPKIQNIAVILEESIVVEDLPDTPTALAYLLGLLYALNISYPKHLKYTFETLQKVFMDIDPKCSNRV
ncbi:uncharacterized protein LOC134101179 [Sardina pilchardus]|uniref:uncharacterized protein LOC134101179 n=1 Tax=Sardina pilchardus TaxID=27697 RepID=UPI002E1160CA